MSKWILPIAVSALIVALGYFALRWIAVKAMNLLMEIGSWFKK